MHKEEKYEKEKNYDYRCDCCFNNCDCRYHCSQPVLKNVRRSFDAVVQEIVTQPDGEVRLIVERTTEIYGDPVNSLGISEDTKLLEADGNEISINDFKPGRTVTVKLKDAFIEETPFYYPDVYEIKRIHN